MATKSVSSTVDQDLFERAKSLTGEGQAETIRRALAHFVNSPPPAGVPAAALAAAAPAVPRAAKPVTQMTDEERRASLKLLRKARLGLGEAIVDLRGEEAVASTADKKALRIVIIDLEADLAKVDARITAFQAGQLTMTPPPSEVVDRVAALAEQVGQMTVEANTADRAIAAAREIVRIWSGSQAA